MKIPYLSLAWAVALTLSLAAVPAVAQDPVERIIEEVIGHAVDTARAEVGRNTGADPMMRGYDPAATYQPAPPNLPNRTRLELQKLSAEHDQKIAEIERKLRESLHKAQSEFQREVAKGDKPEKLAKKRVKLEEKTAKAYAKFQEKIAKENRHFDEKRAKILAKAHGG